MKDAKGHGSNARPIPGHPFHAKTNDELRYIAKDAAEAGRNAAGMGDQKGVSKYADQVADAATVMGYRDRGGKSDAPADQLHSGTPKSAPAPTHDSMVGRGRAAYSAKTRAGLASAQSFSTEHAKLVAGGMSPMDAHNHLHNLRKK